jgi:hypothetical protein
MNGLRIFLAVWMVTLLIVSMACVKGSTTLADNHPFAVQGLVFAPYTDDKVTITNTATGESLVIGLISHDDESMEYIGNLANLVDEWQEGDIITVTFSDQTFKVIAVPNVMGARVDFNAPEGYVPTPFAAGTFLVLTAAGYYLIKRRKDKMTETVKPIRWGIVTIVAISILAVAAIIIAAIAYGISVPSVAEITAGLAATKAVLQLFAVPILIFFAVLGAVMYQINGYYNAKTKNPDLTFNNNYWFNTISAAILAAGAISTVDTLSIGTVIAALSGGLGLNYTISKTVATKE